MSVILVSHDLGVIAETCDRVAVMYGGQIVELGSTAEVLTQPRHPYTVGLLQSIPAADTTSRYLRRSLGRRPRLVDPPAGCRFYDRCPIREAECQTWDTELVSIAAGHTARCRRHQAVTLTMGDNP